METQNALHLYDQPWSRYAFTPLSSKAKGPKASTHREELGLSGRELKASPMYPDLYRKAFDLAAAEYRRYCGLENGLGRDT